jgi:hypothetical protein
MFFGPAHKVPPVSADIALERTLDNLGGMKPPRIGPEAAQSARERWRQRKPKFIVIAPDYLTKEQREIGGACPPDVYRELLDGTLGYRLASKHHQPSLFPWAKRPDFDFPDVNPPIRIFMRTLGTEEEKDDSADDAGPRREQER